MKFPDVEFSQLDANDKVQAVEVLKLVKARMVKLTAEGHPWVCENIEVFVDSKNIQSVGKLLDAIGKAVPGTVTGTQAFISWVQDVKSSSSANYFEYDRTQMQFDYRLAWIDYMIKELQP